VVAAWPDCGRQYVRRNTLDAILPAALCSLSNIAASIEGLRYALTAFRKSRLSHGEGEMIVSWMLNTASLFAATIGALLIFLYLWGAPRIGDGRLSPEEAQAGEAHRRRSLAGVGVLAAWLLFNAVGVVLL
jgi:hypothetical protein